MPYSENIQQCKDIATDVVEAIVVMIIFEKLWLQRNEFWFEEHLDFLSIQATMLGESMGRLELLRRHNMHVSSLSG